MPLSPEQRAERLAGTREAASAFLEDMEYIRGVVKNDDPSKGEIRRLSGILRRLLVERDIAEISSPRLGRVTLLAPDNGAAYKAERTRPFLFFASGRGKILGGYSGMLYAYDVKTHPLFGPRKIELPQFDPSLTIELRLDNFLHQRVLCYRGKWASRQDVIKYVANFASGVHSNRNPAKMTPNDILLAKIRSSCWLERRDGGIHLELFAHGIDTDDITFKHKPEAIDPVLIELLAAATFLVESTFVENLEEATREELT